MLTFECGTFVIKILLKKSHLYGKQQKCMCAFDIRSYVFFIDCVSDCFVCEILYKHRLIT